MKITNVDIKILVDLYKSSDGLTAYIFFQRYKYGPAAVFNTVKKFERKKYISTKEDKLFITSDGKAFVERNRFTFTRDKYARIPSEYLSDRIQINEPYLPNIDIISDEILNLKTKGDG